MLWPSELRTRALVAPARSPSSGEATLNMHSKVSVLLRLMGL